MTNIKTPELLPCPFCGGTAFLHEHESEWWYVACNKCINQTTHFFNGKDIVITRWNTRTESERVDEPIQSVWAVQYSNYMPAEIEAIFTTQSEAEKYTDSLGDSMWEVRQLTVFTSADEALARDGDD